VVSEVDGRTPEGLPNTSVTTTRSVKELDLDAAPAQASATDLPARTLASPVLSRAACA
jgi:molybdopterin-binding protein